jgi:glycosyltransferase involved in cell wall biosynthesis
MSIRVLLDATSLPSKPAGVGQYVLGIVGELAARPGEIELHVAGKAKDLSILRERAPGARLHGVAVRSRAARLLWEQISLPRLARRLSVRVVHGPHYTLPLRLGLPGVVTFHDPTFFTNPELHERTKVTYFTRMARLGVARATRVITVSEYARRAAIEQGGARPDHVTVVPLGVDHDRYGPNGEPAADERLRRRLHVEGPFLLWVGTIEPRKDLPNLVTAFSALDRQGASHSLVIAGQRGWGWSELERAIETSGMGKRILLVGYVSEGEKIALYRGADSLVYPSIAEGFGLPVLEAMACGCPVITTTGSAPEEIGGDAVELVPARDPEQLRHAIERVLDDPDRRGWLRRAGLERAKQFSWRRTAAETLETYRLAAREV